jgi:phosphoribosylformylglycinamidine cyclo-ligase
MRYADAGVNISAGDEAKRRIAAMAAKTFRPGVIAPIGGFGSLFRLDRKRWRDPILVSSADGVGTKLKIAFATGMHSTVGADILNHCVNDILTQGAQPLFFLDYIAMGKLDTRVVEQVIDGMSRAAKQAGCALIGGETAEMPDV